MPAGSSGAPRAGPPRCKCVVIGDGCIGKTCMLHSYANNGDFIKDHIPTIFNNYEADIPVGTGADVVKLAVWDTAGQEEYDELRRMCFGLRGPSHPSSPAPSGADAAGNEFDVQVFIVCFALDNPESFTSVETKWYPEIKRVEQELAKAARAAEASGKGNSKDKKRKATAAAATASGAAIERPFTVVLVGTRCDLVEPEGALPRDGRAAMPHDAALQLQRDIRADRYVECSAKTGTGIQEVFASALEAWWEHRERQVQCAAPSGAAIPEDERVGGATKGKGKNDGGGCSML